MPSDEVSAGTVRHGGADATPPRRAKDGGLSAPARRDLRRALTGPWGQPPPASPPFAPRWRAVVDTTAEIVAEIAARTDVVVLMTSLCRSALRVSSCGSSSRSTKSARAISSTSAPAPCGRRGPRRARMPRRSRRCAVGSTAYPLPSSWLPPAPLADRSRGPGLADEPLRALDPLRPTSGRQPDLRSVIARSYRLLDEHELSFLDCLGVFAGGFAVETGRLR